MTFSPDGDPFKLKISPGLPSSPFDFFTEISIKEGHPLICDTCSAELTDGARIAHEDCYQTTYGLVCGDCYDNVFRPDIENPKSPDHGKVRLLRIWKKGEDLHALKGEPAPMSALISCPKCHTVSIIDLGMVSEKKANAIAMNCPNCGAEMER